MSKLPKAEINIPYFLSQFKTNELEEFMREIAALIKSRKTKNKKAREVELLQTLNEDCVLPQAHLERFLFLKKKRENNELPKEELEELFKFIEEEETLRLKRIHILGEIADLRSVSILKVTKDLGIQPTQNV